MDERRDGIARMRVVDRRRWHRTKIGAAVALFLIGLVCAGGLESANATEAIPSPVGFVTAMFLLTWLVIHIIKEGERL